MFCLFHSRWEQHTSPSQSTLTLTPTLTYSHSFCDTYSRSPTHSHLHRYDSHSHSFSLTHSLTHDTADTTFTGDLSQTLLSVLRSAHMFTLSHSAQPQHVHTHPPAHLTADTTLTEDLTQTLPSLVLRSAHIFTLTHLLTLTLTTLTHSRSPHSPHC